MKHRIYTPAQRQMAKSACIRIRARYGDDCARLMQQKDGSIKLFYHIPVKLVKQQVRLRDHKGNIARFINWLDDTYKLAYLRMTKQGAVVNICFAIAHKLPDHIKP